MPEKKIVKCPSCGAELKAVWKKCPECGTHVAQEPEPHIFYPEHILEKGKLDHIFGKSRKEYMLCTVCGKPIKEEESYYDKKQRVFLHLKCHPKFMRLIKEGEVDKKEL